MEKTDTTKKYLVLILTYNEEVHISDVIEDIKKEFPIADILVVDGESTDKTCLVARKRGVWVISISNRLGIAGGMEAGLLFAQQNGYDFLIRIDGDGQHGAKDIDRLLQPVLGARADMVVGSRFKSEEKTYKSSFNRSVGNKIFSFMVSSLAGSKFYDTTSGFQVLNRDVIDYLCQIKQFEYSEVITLLILKKAGYKILEVPVPMNHRIGSQSSFNFIRAFFYVFEGLFSLLINGKSKH